MKVGNESKFDIRMRENRERLEEVRVVGVGYGDVRRGEVRGCMGWGNMGDLRKSGVRNIRERVGGGIGGVEV